MPESRHLRSEELQIHELPDGGEMPTHRHDRGHLLYPAAGVLSITTDTGTWIAAASRAVWTPAGSDHRHRSHGRTDMRLIFLAPRLARTLPSRPAVLAVSPLVREAVLAVTGDAVRSAAGRHRLRHVIVDELARAPEQPLHLPEPRDDRLRAIAALLHRDPADASPLAALGAQVGAGERTLSRLFADELGMSFRRWRTQLRIHHALVLLATGHDVISTALACGWSNPSSFIDAFTAILGQTPGRYRAELASAARAA